MSVAEAKVRRAGIRIDPRYEDAQLKWWVHQKWVEELYDLRSHSIHSGHLHERQWGWTTFEHLVMSAVTFPLMIKLFLRNEGHYELSDPDLGMTIAIDKLLAEAKWSQDEEPERIWEKIVSRSRFSEVMRLKAMDFLKKHSSEESED